MVTTPPLLNATDYETRAREILPAPVFAWLAGGSGDETALADNTNSYRSRRIIPRQLVSAANGSTRSTLLGQQLAAPILLAPIGLQSLVHTDAELATAQGAGALDIPMLVSALTTRPLPEIAAAHGGLCGAQIYLQDLPRVNHRIIHDAEASGCPWLVVTVDVPVTGLRYRELRTGFQIPSHVVPHYADDGARNMQIASGQSRIFQGVMPHAPTWRDIEALRKRWPHVLLIKGLLHPADVERARDCGADAVILSNHGGRALAVAPSPLSMLPAARARLQTGSAPHFPVLIDGGIRSGSDVFLALASGADAVLIGRPQLHALACDGAAGVARLLRLLRDELELTMALAGCPDIDAVRRADLISMSAGEQP